MSKLIEESPETLEKCGERIFEAVNWDVLAHIASELRHDTPCHFEKDFLIVDSNMLRKIVFKDDVHWGAMLRLPILDPAYYHRKGLGVTGTFETEIFGMNFIRAKTSIPVPETHRYDLNPNNAVGAQYVLMNYINGTPAAKMRTSEGCDVGLYGTADQDRNFKRQMAEIQAELASHKFRRIGSVYQYQETKEFTIGPDIEIGKGPWRSSSDYFTDLAVKIEHVFIQGFFREALPYYGHLNRHGPFSLTNRNFGAHNTLVNKNFEIVAVIGFNIIAAPIEVVAQYPRHTGLDPEPPGLIENDALEIDRISKTKKKLEEYNGFFKDAEKKFAPHGNSTHNDKEAPIANMMQSDPASLVQGLREYMRFQELINDRWMKSFPVLHRKYLEHIEAS